MSVETIYLDEAGDDSFGPKAGSSWFVMGALAGGTNVGCCHQIRREICRKTGLSSRHFLHFRNLSDNQKHLACQVLGKSGLKAMVAMVHKPPLLQAVTPFGKRRYLYELAVGCLWNNLSKISDSDGLRIIFSGSRRTDYPSLLHFLGSRPADEGPKGAPGDRFSLSEVSAKRPQEFAGLQLVDIVVSSCFQAINPDQHGKKETAYQMLLSPILALQVRYPPLSK